MKKWADELNRAFQRKKSKWVINFIHLFIYLFIFILVYFAVLILVIWWWQFSTMSNN
jgi:hypothetical protein